MILSFENSGEFCCQINLIQFHLDWLDS